MRPFLRTYHCLYALRLGPQARDFSSSSRNVKVSVWWDFENCQVPAGIDASDVAPAITKALRANGIKGPLRINAFGDLLLFSKLNLQSLALTGIHFTHIPGGKNSADRFLLVNLMDWVSQNPPPAHLFLISGDTDFAGILHRLRMNNYNILLATPRFTSDVFYGAATIIWQWSSILKGEYLSGKHFNHPPDGLFGSWYGNYKVLVDKPISADEQLTSSRKVVIYKPPSDLHGIPKAVVRQIWCILRSHPKGISIGDLREKLKNCDVHFPTSFYGYRKFSSMLYATPQVKLKYFGDGEFHVYLVPESLKPFESNAVELVTSCIKIDERGSAATPKLNGEDKDKAREANETPLIASSHERSMDDNSKSFQLVTCQVKPMGENVDAKSSISLVDRHVPQPPNELQKSSLCSGNVVDMTTAQLSKIQPQLKDDQLSKTKQDSLKMSSKSSSDDDIVGSEDACRKSQERYTTSSNRSAGNDPTAVDDIGTANYESGNVRATEKCVHPTRKEVDDVCQSLYAFPVDDSLVDKKTGGSDETYMKGPTFFGWIGSWWQFWKGNAKSGDSTAHQNKEVNHFEDSNSSELVVQTVSDFEDKSSELHQNAICSGKPELFSSSSFWNDMESFVFTLKGSRIVSQSKNREDMAHKLQKDGALVLRSLTQKDILQLVELLISEKKWLEESPSQTFPFRLTQPVQRNSLMGQSHGANGLSSLFLSRATQSNLQTSFEHDVEKHNQSIPHTRVSATATETKYTERSRNDILEDCQKLVNEILREHPEGYKISSYPRLFVDRYGYHLDFQKLGYQKLASLLQIMPEVKVESTYIFPSVPAVSASEGETFNLETQVPNACPAHATSNSDSELSDSSAKDGNTESPWEEFCPVSVNNSNQSNLESELSQKAMELFSSKCPDYEPIVSDYDSSESEGDIYCLYHPEEQEKPKCNEQDSSFWQAPELLHSSKEGENSVKKSDNIDISGNSLVDIFNSSTESTQGTLSIEKPRFQKNYSFVAEPVLPSKDKLIDGIVDSFKKADESETEH